MKPKIKITENGYWISDDWMYLDEKNYKIENPISYPEFFGKFKMIDKYDYEWKENRPFGDIDVARFWLESEKCCVEIAIHKKSIDMYKCFLCEQYDTSTGLIRDITDLDELFIDLRGEVERVIKEMEEE